MLIELSLLPTEQGGKTRVIQSGYRPQYKVKSDYLTSGHTELVGQDHLQPGETAQAMVTLLTPEAYPQSLVVNDVLHVQEGNKVVGSAKILVIYNPILARNG